jgi:diguanylate cyclase (GGDEF)-like protein
VFAWEHDAERAHRTGGILAVAASALGMLLSAGVSQWAFVVNAVLLAMLALVGAIGAFAVVRPERMPPLGTVAALVGGTLFISAGMVLVGPAGVIDADNEMLYLVPLLHAAYFCRGWVVVLVGSAASLSYGAVLLHVGSAVPAARWVTTTGAFALVAALVFFTRRRDVQLMAAAAEQALVDPLTGVLNRRGLEQQGAHLRDGQSLSLLLVDIDHFKAVNDVHGHAVGDDVLVRVAQVLRSGLRDVDVVARFGGEEFVLLLPGCDAAAAVAKAHLLCERVAGGSLAWPARITLSVGVAAGRRDGADLTSLLVAADRALYAAKAAGRNTVRLGQAAPTTVVIPEQISLEPEALPERT